METASSLERAATSQSVRQSDVPTQSALAPVERRCEVSLSLRNEPATTASIAQMQLNQSARIEIRTHALRLPFGKLCSKGRGFGS